MTTCAAWADAEDHGYGTASVGFSVAIGDLDGDGRLDLAVAAVSANAVSVLLGNGDGTFGARRDYGTGSRPISVALADLDRDGRLDLAVANYSSNTVTTMLNTGGSPRADVTPIIGSLGPLRVVAWPNPCAVEARVVSALRVPTAIRLTVYDVAGRVVSTIARGEMPAGTHEAVWRLNDDSRVGVGSGVYLVELRAGSERVTTRIAVLR